MHISHSNVSEVSQDAVSFLKANRLEVVKKLGDGGFGIVHLVRSRASAGRAGRLYAAKVVCEPRRTRDGKHIAEAYIHQRLNQRRHSNKDCITRLLHIFRPIPTLPATYALIFEYANAGTLHDLCVAYRTHKCYIPEGFLWSLLRDMAAALAHMATHKITHRDIHGLNILLQHVETTLADGAYPRAVLADFGEAICTDQQPEIDGEEAVEDSEPADDVWTAGLLVRNTAYGRHDVIEDPRYFCDHCQQDHPVKTSRRGENGSIQLPQQYSDKLSDLPGHLLEATPSKRWSGQQLLTYLESEAPQMIQAHFMALRPWAISSAH